jgi:Flp pilus assembly protein TadD
VQWSGNGAGGRRAAAADAAALGRRALFADVRPTARLAQTAYDAARRALALDSTNAFAHNVVGKVNSEVSNLPTFYRWLAANVLGITAARRASWTVAEHHLRRAIALDPAMIRFRVDLGELYLRTGRRADAARTLREVATLSRRHPPDAKFQAEAAAMLRDAVPP